MLVKEKIAAKVHNLAPTFGLEVFKIVEIIATSQSLCAGARRRVQRAAARSVQCSSALRICVACRARTIPASRALHVCTITRVAAGRVYLVEFPGLGDMRQFRWEAEYELLKTPGIRRRPLVEYDRLRNAERRVAFVPDCVNDDVHEEVVPEPKKRKPGRPKKKLEEAAPLATVKTAKKVASVPMAPVPTAPTRAQHVRQPSRRLQDAGAGNENHADNDVADVPQ